MHAKYEVSISYGSKVIANVKVDNRQTDRQTNKETGQKQYAPDHSIRGHKKNVVIIKFISILTKISENCYDSISLHLHSKII